MKIPFSSLWAQIAAKYVRVGVASIGVAFLVVATLSVAIGAPTAAYKFPTIAAFSIIDTTPISSRAIGETRLNTPATAEDVLRGQQRAEESRIGLRGTDADDDWMAASIPDSIVGATARDGAGARVPFNSEDNRSAIAGPGAGRSVVERTPVAIVPDAGGTLMLLGVAIFALFSLRRCFHFR